MSPFNAFARLPAGSVDALLTVRRTPVIRSWPLKPALAGAVSGNKAEHSLAIIGLCGSDGAVEKVRVGSLWQRATDLTTGVELGEGWAVAEADFPTQRRHSKAHPKALSHRPISLAGKPVSFAQARLE